MYYGVDKNYDTVLRGRGQGVCDDSTEAVVIKSVTMGEGVQTLLNLRDVIYERPPLMKVSFIKCEYILVLECLIISVAKVKMWKVMAKWCKWWWRGGEFETKLDSHIFHLEQNRKQEKNGKFYSVLFASNSFDLNVLC